MPNGWRTINSLVHKIRLHGRRGKGMAESFSRQKSRHAPQKEGGLKILCDLPPVWPRLVRPTNLMSRMDGKKTHNTLAFITRGCSEGLGVFWFFFKWFLPDILYCVPNVICIGEPVWMPWRGFILFFYLLYWYSYIVYPYYTVYPMLSASRNLFTTTVIRNSY